MNYLLLPKEPSKISICPLKGKKCDVDVENIKVFTRAEWNQMNSRMHTEEIQAEKRKKEIEAHENVKKQSAELHKDWTNTNLVGILYKRGLS